MRIRRNIDALDGRELRTLREAFRKLQDQRGGRNYQLLAGLYGLPNPSNCPRHLPDFLPWHRCYLLDFEEALREQEPDVVLPYWDWTSARAAVEGLPRACTEESYEGPDGTRRENPLRVAQNGVLDRPIQRRPRAPAALARLRGAVELAHSATTLHEAGSSLDFTSLLEQTHDSLHAWVGGDMGRVAHAAFDPILGLHLANLDRHWAAWQGADPTTGVSDELASIKLPVYEMSIGDVLDIETMGYAYDRLRSSSDEPEAHVVLRAPDGSLTPAEGRWATHCLHRVSGLRLTMESLELRVFVDQPDADVRTQTDGHPAFVDAIALPGMDGAVNPRGYLGEYSRIVDIAPALERIGLPRDSADLTLVAANETGSAVPLETLEMELRVSRLPEPSS